MIEANDLLALKSLNEGSDMSSFEGFMVADKNSRHPSGTSIAAITIGSAALLAGIGAWVFGGVYANQGARGNARLIEANQMHTNQMLTLLAANQNNDRAERVAYQNAANKTVVDIVSGATATSSSNSASNAYAQAEAQIVSNALTGASQLCPKPVTIYSAPQPCDCPCRG